MSGHPSAAAAELRALIAAIRRRWFKAVALRTAGRAAAGASAAVLAGLAADKGFRPEGVALLLLAALTLVAVVAAVFLVVRRMQPRPDDRHVARFVEERAASAGADPMDDALVSAVDVMETPAGERSHFSALVVAEAVRRLRDVERSRIIATAVLRRATVEALAGAVLILVAGSLSAPALSRTVETARLQLFPGSITIDVLPGDARVAAGTSFRIKALVRDGRGVLAHAAPALTVTAESGRRTAAMPRTGDAFEFVFESVDRSFSYTISAGAARSASYTVTALFAARVRRIDLDYTYPSFTGLEPRTEEDGGDIYAPAGTRVRLRIRTDKPVARGEIATASAAVSLQPSGDCMLEAELVLTKDDSYRVRLVDDDGLRANGETEYFIRLMDDRPPDVRILRPSADQQITPLEEVAIEARADDDYGIAAFDLVYAVAGGPERVARFDRVTGTDVEKVGSRLLPAEDLQVKPGDVITYYARVRDVPRGKRSTETRSDIFFLEVKPFNEEFVAAQTQASSGAAGAEIEGLVAAQKEIISATWNIERRSGAGRSAEDVAAVAKAQAELKARAEKMTRGSGRNRGRAPAPEPLAAIQSGRPPQPSPSGDPVASAVEAMGRAIGQLEAQKTKDAIAHEMAALNGLLQAQAEIRRREVSRGASGSGNGGNRAGQDLTALFDKELQRQQRTNYETKSSVEDKSQQGNDKNEALDRIRDLAKRQEDLSRRQRELADAGLSAEEMKRRLETLTREQMELRQQAEDLARRQEAQGQGRDVQSAAEQMRSATSDLRRDDAKGAAENGARAAERLRHAEQQMRGGGGGTPQQTGELQMEAQQIAQEQRRIAAEAGRLEDSKGPAADEARRRLADEKERLAGRVEDLQRSAKKDRQAASTADALERERIAERMRESAKAMRGGGREGQRGQQSSAASSEQEIARALDRALGKLGGEPSADARKLGDQLDQTREIRERLNRLEQQMRQAEARAARLPRPGRPARKPRNVRRRPAGRGSAEAAAGVPARAAARARGAGTLVRRGAAQRNGDVHPGGAGVQPVGPRHRGVQAGSIGLGVAAQGHRPLAREVRGVALRSAGTPAIAGSPQRRRKRARAGELPRVDRAVL